MRRTGLLAVVVVLACFAAGAENSAWRVLGPGGGGAQFLPTISPHDSNRVLVACDMTGSYLTDDAGASWRMFNLRGRARFFVFDPVDPKRIYVQAVGLWRSNDAARTWELVYPPPGSVKGMTMPDDHASVRLMTSDGPARSVLALAVDPTDSRVLYAAFQENAGCSLRRSADGGSSWTIVREFNDGARGIFLDPRSPAGDRTMHVVLERSVASRRTGQWRAGSVPPGVAGFTDVSAGYPRSGGELVVYALAPVSRKDGVLAGGVLVSRDGGASWEQTTETLLRESTPLDRPPVFQAVATALSRPEVAYVSVGNLKYGSDKPSFGVLKTVDSGKSWEMVWRESDAPARSVDAEGWVSERFGPGWGENPLDLGVAPNDPELCYGTDYGRTLKTTDGGRTWKAVYTRRQAGGGYTSTGLDVTTCYGVHHDPFDRKRVFISYTDIGLFGSEDGGKSWSSATTAGVPRDWLNTTYWVEFDPQVRGRMWAVMSNTHDLPRPKMWRGRSPSQYRGGICRSDDGGRNWSPLTSGMPPTAATHVLLDPASPPGARVLYVAGYGKGVFKSTDGGATWSLKNTGLPASEPFAWRISRDSSGALYLVVARRTETAAAGAAGEGGLYRSVNAAESWERVPLPEGVNGPNGLTIDPSDPKRLYLSAWGRPAGESAAGGGVFLSTDGGGAWRPVLSADQHVYDVTVDPRDPNLLYACGFESSAWRSADRGETWRRIRGYNFKWGHRVVPDPLSPGMIYVTTFGGSVWHGPGAGSSGATEDIVTPVLRYSR